MEHICENCIYKYEPTSVDDYYKKTLTMPAHFCKWGQEYYKHWFWLCSNENVGDKDNTDNSIIYRNCREYNINGGCIFFKTPNAIDILPSTVSIAGPTEPLTVGDEATITVTVTPYSTDAVTEERQKLDIDGQPLFDENENPIMETVILEEAFVNDQDISYTYQWYKNGRKLFSKKSNVLELDTTKPSVDEYFCEVIQSIVNNGDGGLKMVSVKSDAVIVTVEAAEEPVDPDNPDDPIEP